MDRRAEFPILSTMLGKRRLVYLDNASTTNKPACVLEAARHYYEAQNSNIHPVPTTSAA
ncbi:MAG: aminotransferase class V-fold PLP-dependent enzyme, partial [Akkermansia sp.]|nr:aminotransferase class V-fold PLP-dependent enzyme [Akkermansia sp.]